MINKEGLILNPMKSNLSSYQKQMEQLKLNFSISRPKMVFFFTVAAVGDTRFWLLQFFYGEKEDWFISKMKLWLVISGNRRQKFLLIHRYNQGIWARNPVCLSLMCPVSYCPGCAADTVKNKAPSTLTRCDTKGERKPCHLLCHAEGRKQQIVLEELQKVNLTLVPFTNLTLRSTILQGVSLVLF